MGRPAGEAGVSAFPGGQPGEGLAAELVVGCVDDHPGARDGLHGEAGGRGGDPADARVAEDLHDAARLRDVVRRPGLGERRARGLQAADEVGPRRIADMPAVRRAQLRHHGVAVHPLVIDGAAAGRAGEDGKQRVPLGGRGGGDPGEQHGVHLVPREQVEPLGDHAGGQRKGVEDQLDLGGQRAVVAAREGRSRAGDVGQPEQVRPFGGVEPQHPGDRVEDLDAGVDRAALLQPRVPGDADPGQLGELLAAQAAGAAASAGGQPDVLGADAFPAGAEERRELGPAGAGAVRGGCGHVIHPLLWARTVPGGISTRITRLLVPA